MTKNTENVSIQQPEPYGEAGVMPPGEPGSPALTAQNNINIRSGPGTFFEILGVLEYGQRAELAGVSSDGEWFAISVTTTENGLGWVSAEFSLIENADNIPVIE